MYEIRHLGVYESRHLSLSELNGAISAGGVLESEYISKKQKSDSQSYYWKHWLQAYHCSQYARSFINIFSALLNAYKGPT